MGEADVGLYVRRDGRSIYFGELGEYRTLFSSLMLLHPTLSFLFPSMAIVKADRNKRLDELSLLFTGFRLASKRKAQIATVSDGDTDDLPASNKSHPIFNSLFSRESTLVSSYFLRISRGLTAATAIYTSLPTTPRAEPFYSHAIATTRHIVEEF